MESIFFIDDDTDSFLNRLGVGKTVYRQHCLHGCGMDSLVFWACFPAPVWPASCLSSTPHMTLQRTTYVAAIGVRNTDWSHQQFLKFLCTIGPASGPGCPGSLSRGSSGLFAQEENVACTQQRRAFLQRWDQHLPAQDAQPTTSVLWGRRRKCSALES